MTTQTTDPLQEAHEICARMFVRSERAMLEATERVRCDLLKICAEAQDEIRKLSLGQRQ